MLQELEVQEGSLIRDCMKSSSHWNVLESDIPLLLQRSNPLNTATPQQAHVNPAPAVRYIAPHSH